MFRIRTDPIWLMLLLLLLAVGGWLIYPADRLFFTYALVAVGVLFLLRLGFWLFKLISGMPVPDSAVRELIDRCAKEGQWEEWVLVRFRPKVSLEEARRKVGSQSYTEQDRLEGFMTKFAFVAPSRPDLAIFYSPNTGYLLGRSGVINALEQKHGRWMLDTWYTLLGAMHRQGVDAWNLDSPQLFWCDQHVGSADDWQG